MIDGLLHQSPNTGLWTCINYLSQTCMSKPHNLHFTCSCVKVWPALLIDSMLNLAPVVVEAWQIIEPISGHHPRSPLNRFFMYLSISLGRLDLIVEALHDRILLCTFAHIYVWWSMSKLLWFPMAGVSVIWNAQIVGQSLNLMTVKTCAAGWRIVVC